MPDREEGTPFPAFPNIHDTQGLLCNINVPLNLYLYRLVCWHVTHTPTPCVLQRALAAGIWWSEHGKQICMASLFVCAFMLLCARLRLQQLFCVKANMAHRRFRYTHGLFAICKAINVCCSAKQYCALLQGGLSFDPSNVTAVSLSSTFFNYAPCLVQEAAAGAAFTAVGLNFVPQVRPKSSHVYIMLQLTIAEA